MMPLRDMQPPPEAFAHRFTVLAAHIDELGHAGNVTWVQWLNDAAIAHSRSVGLGPTVYQELGVVWVVRRHDVEYLSPALVGQELEAVTWIETLRGATSIRRTMFRRRLDDKLLVRASTTWALIDIATGRPRRIPADLLARYGFNR